MTRLSPTLLVLGVIIAAALPWIDTTKGVLGYIAENEPVWIFFIVIGALVAIIGFVAGLAGRFGANSVLLLREMGSTARAMDEVPNRSKTRFVFRR